MICQFSPIVYVMCDFISLAFPENRCDFVRQWRRRGFALDEQHNASLRQVLPRGYTPFILTTGGCSCDLCRKHPRAGETSKPKDAIALRDDAALIIRELAPSFLYVHFSAIFQPSICQSLNAFVDHWIRLPRPATRYSAIPWSKS